MGFFSWICKGCGHSLAGLSHQEQWMLQGVAVTKKGFHAGYHDGYGRLDGSEVPQTSDIYHRACWDLLGRPLEWKGGSRSAPDQGVPQGFPEPKTKEDLDAARKRALEKHRKQVAANKAWLKEFRKNEKTTGDYEK